MAKPITFRGREVVKWTMRFVFSMFALMGMANSWCQAQTPLPLYIHVEFGPVVAVGVTDLENKQLTMAKSLIEKLKHRQYNYYFHWKLTAVKASDTQQYPRLVIKVFRDTEVASGQLRWMMESSFQATHKGKVRDVGQRRSETVVLPKVLIDGGIPGSKSRPEVTVKWFEQHFLKEDNGLGLHNLIKDVAPISRGIVLENNVKPQDPEHARGIVLLAFDKFDSLAKSSFRFRCPNTVAIDEEFISSATGKAAHYATHAPSIEVIHKHYRKNEDQKLAQQHLQLLYDLMMAYVTGGVQKANVHFEEYVDYVPIDYPAGGGLNVAD